MLDITLLGAFRVRTAGGADLTPTGLRERGALALLAIAAPHTVSTDRLADELYGDQGGSDPRNAVQATISRIRKTLGRSAGSLETHGAGYRLVDVRLDTDLAEAKLAEAERHSGQQRLETLDEALAMWTGHSLDEVFPSNALEAERFRLNEIRASAEDSRLELKSTLNVNTATLIAELESATRDQPLREKRWELLMLALYQAGRQADALRAYQRARQVLGDQLGLEPGPALAELEQKILSHDPTLSSTSPAATMATTSTDQSSTGERLPSGTVSVLLCDVEGSVHQWEVAPDATAEGIADLHEIWSHVVSTHGGVLIKSTGDGILAVFDMASDAIGAAVAGQQAHHQSSDLKVRVAVHTGPITPVDGDYRGPLVNRCARLLELTAGGQILVTATTAGLASDGLAPSVELRPLGSHWLRDVVTPIDLSQVNAPGIAAHFPDIISHGPRGLPRLRSDILGRDELRAEIVQLAGEVPLITLLGPGGIGKTTLSLSCAWEVAETRHVCFVDLAAIKDPNTVARRVADAVSHSDDDRQPSERIADRLRTNTDLIVLDNAEHVIDAVAEMLDEVLAHELKGSFVVTSRHPLAISGERVVPVPPLPLPHEDADLQTTAKAPAVALFLNRLKQAKSQMALPSGLLPVVAHICRRLDGIPLAIELAAGRASVLAIEDIAARLDDQLRLLRQVPVTRERRHRSLEAVVTWSLDQLDTGTRNLFRMLSVFAGDFSMSAVEQVMIHLDLDHLDALDQLSELSSASLLVVERGSRFRMLEPIRQVAAAELATAGSEREARWAHARWICDLLTEAFVETSQGRSEKQSAADIEGEEIRAATARIAEDGFYDLVSDLAVPGGYWFVSRDPNRGAELWGKIVDSLNPDEDELTFAMAVVGWSTSAASHPNTVRPGDVHRAIDTLRRAEHPYLGLAHVVASYSHLQAGDLSTAIELLDQAETLISTDDLWPRAILDMTHAALNSLALMMNQTPPHNIEAVELRGEQAAGTFRHLGDRWALGVTLGELGRLKQYRGDLEGAERCLLESIELLDSTEFHGLHYILSEVAKVASRRGDHDAAAIYHRQALEIAEQDGGNLCMAVSYGALAESAELKGDIDEAIEFYERALALESRYPNQGVPGGWQECLDRLRALSR